MTEHNTKPGKPRRMARVSKPKPDATNTAPITKTQSKASMVEGLLQQAEGASLTDLCQATAWLPHTCRAFLTGLRKKGRDLEKSKREDGTTIYRLPPMQAAA